MYNAEKTIRRCLRSILEQSYTDLEIIVIDDGSVDKSGTIIDDIATEHRGLRVIHNENQGVSASRNIGLSIAQGEYITFVDCDDCLQPNALDVMVRAISGHDWVIGSYTKTRGSRIIGTVRYEPTVFQGDLTDHFWQIDELLNTPWAKLFRADIIRKNQICFDHMLSIGEDHLFNLQYLGHVESINVISDSVYRYTLGGMLSTVKYHEDMDMMFFKLIQAYDALINCQASVAKKAGELYEAIIRHYLVCLDKDAACSTCSAFLEKLRNNDRFGTECLQERLTAQEYALLCEAQYAAFLKRYRKRISQWLLVKKTIRRIRITIR